MRISDTLVEKLLKSTKKISSEQLSSLRQQAKADKKPLQDLAIQGNIVNEKDLTKLYAKEIDIPFVELNPKEIKREVLRLIPERIARQYNAVLFGVVPMALLGLVYYGLLLIYSLGVYLTGKRVFKYLLLVFTAGGLLFTFYLLYIQAFLIGKACLYCIASAVISVIVFVIAQYLYPFERKQSWVTFQGFVYRKIMRRFIFLIDSEIFFSDNNKNFKLKNYDFTKFDQKLKKLLLDKQ